MSQKIDLKVEYTNRLAQENEALKARVEQLQEKIFELQCFDVYVIRCIKTMAFDHNHSDIPRYKQLAKECMYRISAENKANEIKARAFKQGFDACINASVKMGIIYECGEFADQLRQAAKEQK